MSERVYRLGRGPWQRNRVGFGVCQAAGSPIIQLSHGVLELEMRWQHMFRLFVHCLWVWKGRMDVSERIYRLGRGPWQRNRVAESGVCQAAGSPRFQPINGVLQREMRWQHMFTLFVLCLWVWKGRTDVSERCYRLGRGPLQRNRVGFGVCQAAGSPIIQPINGVLELEMRWQHMFRLFVHCLWVLKGSRAAGLSRFQLNDGVLR